MHHPFITAILCRQCCRIFAILLIVACSRPVLGQAGLDAVRQHRRDHAPAILRQFAELLSIPNVGRDVPNINRNADYIRDEFTKRGVEIQLLKNPRRPNVPPLIYGEINTPGATRTIGIYVHYDGQPSDPKQWTTKRKPLGTCGKQERKRRILATKQKRIRKQQKFNNQLAAFVSSRTL